MAERGDAIRAMAEVFREHGYAGASLALIGEATGLGKGSLYHFFPGGKDEMVAAVLAEIDRWFADKVFAPLLGGGDADAAIAAMFRAVADYFHSGRRVCLVGVLAVGGARDRFAATVSGYFGRWVQALAAALRRQGRDAGSALVLAEEVVAGIQGAIVLSRALGDPSVFERALRQLEKRVGGDTR